MFVGMTLHLGYGIRRYLFDVEFDTIAGILYIFPFLFFSMTLYFWLVFFFRYSA